MNEIYQENITADIFDPQIGYPAKEYDGTSFDYPGGGWLLPSVGTYPGGASTDGQAHNNTVGSFSAVRSANVPSCRPRTTARAASHAGTRCNVFRPPPPPPRRAGILPRA